MLTPASHDDVLPTLAGGEDVVVVAGTAYRVDLLDAPDATTASWAHPGVAVGPDGTAWWTAPDGVTVRSLRPDGRRGARVVDVIEGHGLAVDTRGGLWVADPGRKATVVGAEVARRIEPGRVHRFAPDGTRTLDLADPGLGGGAGEGWRPSGVALRDHGAADDRVWVADGYGESRVHAFTAGGDLLWSSDGGAAGTPFQTPHGVVVDDRAATPRLLVADRGNARIVALSLDGDVLGAVGAGELTSPSGFALDGRRLWVTELFGALRVLDDADRVVGSLGDAPPHPEPAWPNALTGDRLGRPEVAPGALRAPHGIAVTAAGEVLVTEWIVGGRVTRLTPIAG